MRERGFLPGFHAAESGSTIAAMAHALSLGPVKGANDDPARRMTGGRTAGRAAAPAVCPDTSGLVRH
jgi:hypothetical protein